MTNAISPRTTGVGSAARLGLVLALVAGLAAGAETNHLSLAECEAYANAHSLGLWRQQLDADNSRHQKWIAWETFLAPRVSAQGSRSWLRDPAVVTEPVRSGSLSVSHTLPFGISVSGSASGTDQGIADSATWSAEVSKKLLGGGSWFGSIAGVWNSELGEEIAAHTLAAFGRNLIRDVRQRYHDVIRTRQTLVSHRLRLEQARRNLQLATAREEPLDIATAQVEVPQAEAAVLRGERAVLTALDRIKETIGMPLETVLTTADDLPFAPVVIELPADLAWCLEHQEEVLNQQLKIRTLRHELIRLVEDEWPDVTLAVRRTRPLAEGVEGDEEERITLRAEWALGGIAERSRAAIQRNAILDARIELQQIRISLQRDVTDLARRLDEARRQVEIGQARLTLARTRARLYQDRWDNGEIDIIEYIRSQNDVEDSRVNLIDEQMSYLDLLASYRALIAR
jgi:outer membrane protein TolC